MVEATATLKRLRMWQDFERFFSAEPVSGNKGFAVATVRDNEFGAALSATGIGPGWRVTECGGKVLGHKMFVMLKNQIAAASKRQPQDGYALALCLHAVLLHVHFWGIEHVECSPVWSPSEPDMWWCSRLRTMKPLRR